MNTDSKCCLFIVTFCCCLFLYFMLAFILPFSQRALWLDVFEVPAANFTFFLFCLLGIAYVITEVVYAVFYKKTRRPQIGEVLITLDLITPDELDTALKLQQLKIGEVLVQGGRVTPVQIKHAIDVQKKKHRRIGEILKELGYSTEEDIRWAANRTHQKIGKVLQNMNKITDYDIDCSLSIGKTCRISGGKLTNL